MTAHTRFTNDLLVLASLAVLANLLLSPLARGEPRHCSSLTSISAPRDGITVVDGDSLRFAEGCAVRLYGIDAPELGQRCYNTNLAHPRLEPIPQLCGQEAKNALHSLIQDMPDHAWLRCRRIDYDAHGRLVARCAIEDREGELLDLAAWLAESGHVVAYDRFIHLAPDLIARYRSAEKRARDGYRGVWRHDTFEHPDRWRRKNQQP